MAPVRVCLQPLDGVAEGGTAARHGKAGLLHEVDVVDVPAEVVGEFLRGEEGFDFGDRADGFVLGDGRGGGLFHGILSFSFLGWRGEG